MFGNERSPTITGRDCGISRMSLSAEDLSWRLEFTHTTQCRDEERYGKQVMEGFNGIDQLGNLMSGDLEVDLIYWTQPVQLHHQGWCHVVRPSYHNKLKMPCWWRTDYADNDTGCWYKGQITFNWIKHFSVWPKYTLLLIRCLFHTRVWRRWLRAAVIEALGYKANWSEISSGVGNWRNVYSLIQICQWFVMGKSGTSSIRPAIVQCTNIHFVMLW